MTSTLLAACAAPVRRAGFLAASLTGFLALILVSAGPIAAQEKDPLVAKVNGVEIHESDLAAAEEEAGQLPPMAPDAKKDYLVQFLTDMILVSKDAEQKKIGDTPAFKTKLEFARKKLLMETSLAATGKEAMTDAAMKAVYDDALKQMGPEEEVHARHILVRATPGDDKASKEAEDKIKAVIARLKKGEDFVKVAGDVTEDPSGKANGGDLGYFGKEQMVPEFADVAFKLNKGQLSDPVKTQFGWHVIKVEDKRTKAPPTFDEVKPQIEQYVQRKAQAELVTGLRASAKIEKNYTVAPPTPAPLTPLTQEPEKK